MLLAYVATLLLATGELKPAIAVERRVTSEEEFERALVASKPGDRVLLAPGTYGGCAAADVQGAAGRPIVVRAADPTSPPIFTGGLHFSDVAYVEFEQLVITGTAGNGLNIDDGGSFETPSHHLAIRHLTVRDCGGRANHDGIKLSGVQELVIEDCTVERWGRGGSAIDLVGCRGIRIEACAFRDGERDAAATGVQVKGGSRDVVIRRCRFEHAGQRAVNIGGSTGLAYFRPKPEGFEAKDIVVEGCTFVGSMAPVAFVGIDGATVRFNTFYRPSKWILRILQETREPDFVPCRRGGFTDNLVVYRAADVSTPVNIGPGTEAESFVFERNYWYAEDTPTRSPPSLPRPEREPKGGADPLFRDPANGDLRLRPESPARGHGADALPPR